MANISQGTYSQSMYRNSNFSNRYNHHPEYSQYNVGPRRSAFCGGGGNCSSSFRMNHRQNSFAQRSNHSWSIPEVVRETGLILEVQREYGRILSQTNFSAPNIHIYFSLSTLVNDAPLSVITDNLADIFQAGAVVEIEVEGGVNLKELKDNIQVILTCNIIKPSTETGRKPELVPMVVIQDDCEVPLALITNHELVALSRHVFPVEEVTSAFMAKKSSVTTNVEWPEFATIGRSIEGRILNAPPWIRDFTNPTVKKIALSVQRFGRDREGFAVIKEYIGQGVVLTPIDEDDKKICGDLFFPYEMRTDAQSKAKKCEDVYRLGSKWYFRACPELPNRMYKYRVYNLHSLDDVINGDYSGQERFPKQTTITNHGSVAVDVSTNIMEAVASTNQTDNSDQLIEFDDELLSVSSPNSSFPKAAAVSPVTLNLLSTVDFDVSHTATTSGINETVLLESSNSSDIADNCNLLVDFDGINEIQQVATQVRQFHIMDEDFTLSSFNFDIKKENESICMDSQNKELENADLNHIIINGFNTPEVQELFYLSKQLIKVESNDSSLELTTCKQRKCVENCSTLCNGNSAIEQLANITVDSSLIDQEVDTSDNDSENKMFHAVPVERQDDDGWWFTRKVSNGANSAEVRKTNRELIRLSYSNAGNSEATEFNSIPNDDEPLLILNDDHTKNCETSSVTATSQLSLSNTLENDGVYAKFFAGLLRK